MAAELILSGTAFISRTLHMLEDQVFFNSRINISLLTYPKSLQMFHDIKA